MNRVGFTEVARALIEQDPAGVLRRAVDDALETAGITEDDSYYVRIAAIELPADPIVGSLFAYDVRHSPEFIEVVGERDRLRSAAGTAERAVSYWERRATEAEDALEKLRGFDLDPDGHRSGTG